MSNGLAVNSTVRITQSGRGIRAGRTGMLISITDNGWYNVQFTDLLGYQVTMGFRAAQLEVVK